MLKLGQALGAWAPGDGQGREPHDPIVLLGAAWSEIVGDDIAKHSHPAQIERGALIVATRSSAWSQQLSFLTEPILAAVRARLSHVVLDRLRFRVGKLPTRGGPRAAQRVAADAAPRRSPHGESADALEALARLREGVELAERAKRARGWKECVGCTALIAPDAGPLCPACAIARKDQRERLVSRLLFEAPWLGFAGTSRLVEALTYDEYERIRQRLLARWWQALLRARMSGKLSRDGSERLIASSYVLLKSELAPESIGPATVRNVLGDELHDLIYGTEHLK